MMGWPSMKYLGSSLGTYWKLPLPSQRLFQRSEVAPRSLCDRMNASWHPSLLKSKSIASMREAESASEALRYDDLVTNVQDRKSGVVGYNDSESGSAGRR